MAREFDDIKDGTKLEPYHLNIIYRELRRLRKMTAAPPLALDGMTSTTSPPVLWAASGDQGQLAKTSSAITARAGTTAGTGTVIYQDFDGTDLAAADATDVDVFNFSGTAIATGLYCVVTEFSGYLFVTSVEC
jgi:hypothetical protein